MKLIDESRIADGSNEAYLKLKHNAYFGNGFQSGVYFAENELQNLAIEFADWITTAECTYAPIGDNTNEWIDLSKEGITIIINSKELFQEFIKQRK